MKRDNFYLLNVFRKKLAYPDLKRAVIEQKQLFSPTTILIEDKASGTRFIQDLIEGGLPIVTRFKPDVAWAPKNRVPGPWGRCPSG